MDELIMNLFSLIADQVRNKQELFDEEARIMETLLNDGYHLQEADAALTLMQRLVQRRSENFFGTEQTDYPAGIRAMNSDERRRFTSEAFAFTVKLTYLGILSEDQREETLEKCMSVYREQIGLEQVKAIVAFMLFAGSHDREDMSSSGIRAMRETSWN